jgi:ABC-2 type transport system ATP-binding protein
MTNMIVANRLSRSFDDNVAVADLSLEIKAGEVFGLLGPNGAGKTTTIRMLSALISPTAGTAEVAGYQIGTDNQAIRKNVGILTESPGMYLRLSAERNLSFFAALYEIEDVTGQVEKYLRLLGLWERRHEEVGQFSRGMRQKLAIARALLHEPKVLFLDEPTTGLDPEAARLIREFINELREEGRTIMITTHNLDEAERLCDRIAVFKSQLLALDTPANLRQQMYGRSVVFHLGNNKDAFGKALEAQDYVHNVKIIENKIVATLDDPETHNPELISLLVGLGAEIQFVGELRRSLEDVYLRLVETQEETQDG